MISSFLRRFAASLLLLLIVLSTTFLIVHLAPGEPSRLFDDPRLDQQQRQQLRARLGLDQPLHHQYVSWMSRALRGDWGTSFAHNRPATTILLERLPATLVLVLAVTLIELSTGVLAGILAARRQGQATDLVLRMTALGLYAVPIFWLALLAIEVFGVRWQLLPINQMFSLDADRLSPLERAIDLLWHLALPALTLGLARAGGVFRFVRNSLLDESVQDYSRTAAAFGLHPRRILWSYLLPNATLPLIQRLGVTLPLLLSGSLVIEVVFSWPGIGLAVFRAAVQRDYPIILASTALAGVLVILGSLVADLLHHWLDPRLRDRAPT